MRDNFSNTWHLIVQVLNTWDFQSSKELFSNLIKDIPAVLWSYKMNCGKQCVFYHCNSNMSALIHAFSIH